MKYEAGDLITVEAGAWMCSLHFNLFLTEPQTISQWEKSFFLELGELRKLGKGYGLAKGLTHCKVKSLFDILTQRNIRTRCPSALRYG